MLAGEQSRLTNTQRWRGDSFESCLAVYRVPPHLCGLGKGAWAVLQLRNMGERIWNKQAGKKELLGCLQALGFAIYLYFSLKWWGYIFLSVLYGRSVVDQENLKIVWKQRRARVPAGVSNGDLFTDILAFSPGYSAHTHVIGRPRIFISHGQNDQVSTVRDDLALVCRTCALILVLRLGVAHSALWPTARSTPDKSWV